MQFFLAFEWWWQDNLVFQLWHGKTKNKEQKQSSRYKVLFVIADQEEVTLTIFDDKLSVLYAIYKQQSGHDKELSQLTEEDLTEMLLRLVWMQPWPTVRTTKLYQSPELSIVSIIYTEQNIQTVQILTCPFLVHFWSSYKVSVSVTIRGYELLTQKNHYYFLSSASANADGYYLT